MSGIENFNTVSGEYKLSFKSRASDRIVLSYRRRNWVFYATRCLNDVAEECQKKGLGTNILLGPPIDNGESLRRREIVYTYPLKPNYPNNPVGIFVPVKFISQKFR